MKSIKFKSIPFDTLKIVYFKIYDKEQDPEPFFDSTDEQILNFLAKKYHETVIILRIEDVEVLEVITRVPAKKILDISELKTGKTNKEMADYADKVKSFQQKYK